jgi:hypothetical protein
MHGLIFETSICYWQDQPGSYFCSIAKMKREKRKLLCFFALDIFGNGLIPKETNIK